MLEKELKNIWQNSPQKEIVKFEKSKLLIDLNNDLNKLEKSIFKRDILEVSAALIIMPIFSYYAYFYSHPLAKTGAIIIVLAALFIAYKLIKTQKSKKSTDFTLSMKEQLIESRVFITKEMKLLDNILYWYLLPLSIGMIVFSMGLNKNVVKLLVDLLGLLILNIGVYYLNKRTVKKKFLPIISNINTSLKELEED